MGTTKSITFPTYPETKNAILKNIDKHIDSVLVISLFFVLPLSHTTALQLCLIFLIFLRGLWFSVMNRDATLFKKSWALIPFALLASFSYFWSVAPWATLSHLKQDLWPQLFAMFGCYYIFKYRCSQNILLLAITAGAFSNFAAISFFQLELPQDFFSYYFSGVGYSSTCAIYFVALALAWNVCQKLNYWIIFLITTTIVLSVLSGILSENRMFLFTAIGLIILSMVLKKEYKVFYIHLVLIIIISIFFVGRYPTSYPEINANEQAIKTTSTSPARLAREFFSEWKRWVENDTRFMIWNNWLHISDQHPYFGTGYGRGVSTFPLNSDQIQSLKLANTTANSHSHNLFLELFLSLGWPGLLSFIFFLFWISKYAIYTLTVQSISGRASLLLILALVSKNMTDVFLVLAPAVLFFAVLGIILADQNKSAYE